MSKHCDILLVDDHTLFRSGLKTLLGEVESYTIAGEASNGVEMLSFIQDHLPDLVLLDIDMPQMNGIEAAERALAMYPDLKIITLSMYGEEDYYFKMVSLGVKGFLLKNSELKDVIAAIDTVSDGGTFFSQELLFNLASNLKYAHTASFGDMLSEREAEILLHICRGESNSEIADTLFISKRTVDKHRANILSKTGCKNTANLVVFAIKNNLVNI